MALSEEVIAREQALRERNEALNARAEPTESVIRGLARPPSPLTPERSSLEGFARKSGIPAPRRRATDASAAATSVPASDRAADGPLSRSESAMSSDGHSNLGPDVEELLSGLPADAQVRVLRERLARAEDELKRGSAHRQALHRQLRDAAERMREATKERETLAVTLRRAEEDRAAAEARSSKAAAAARTAKEAQQAAEAKLASRKSKGDGSGDTVRLGRAEAEIRRLREALVEARAAAGAVEAASKGTTGGPESAAVGALKARLKASERQRADLLGAFRKQMRLVELLKRQRAHIEAARLLGFTEESFAKALKLSGAPEPDRIV